MALQIITGPLTANRTQIVSQHLIRLKQKQPNAKIFYLVPEHLKFDMETEMLTTMQRTNQTTQAAMFDLQVVSFTRLAWFLLPQHSHETTTLSETGLTMIVRHLLVECQDQLYIYRRQIYHQGFVEKLVTLFEELYQAQIDPEDLRMNSVDINISSVTSDDKRRYEELALLYEHFLEQIDHFDLSQYYTLDQLVQYLGQASLDQPHYLVIDHYYAFNTQQLEVLQKVMQRFQQVWVLLPFELQELKASQWSPLLAIAQTTYQSLHQLAHQIGVQIDSPWEIDGPHYPYHESIRSLAQQFKDQQALNPPQPWHRSNHVEWWQLDRPQTALERIANQIHYLVREEGYRYQEMMIVARDLDSYQSLVEPFLVDQGIPIFFDHERSMDDHPLVNWLRAMLQLKRYRWRYEDLMTFLKSELFVFPVEMTEIFDDPEDALYTFENILLANGYFGYRFSQEKFHWQFEQMDENYQDGLTHGKLMTLFRQWLLNLLVPSFDAWSKDITGDRAAQWLYQLLETTQVKEQLIQRRDQLIDAGQLESAREYEQVWQTLMNLLDEFQLVYEHQTLSFDLFCDLLFAGLEEASFHIIPPTLDQVIVTSYVSPQTHPAKICFILDADNYSLPQSKPAQSLLDSYDREAINDQLKSHDSQTMKQLIDIEEFNDQFEALLAYQLLLKATDYLYITHAVNHQSSTREWSPYYQPLIDEENVYTFNAQTSWTYPPRHTSDYGLLVQQFAPLLHNLRQTYENQQVPSVMLTQFYQAIESHATQEEKNVLNQLLDGAFLFDPLPKPLSSQTAQQLFGQHLNLSVSKVEQYYQDPYSHFLLYGLKLQERQRFELNVGTVGDYFHEFLDQLTRTLIEQQLTMQQLTPQQLDRLIAQVEQQLTDQIKFDLFNAYPRQQAIKERLNQSLRHFIHFNATQQQLTNFKPVRSEAIFGLGKSRDRLPGFEYALSSGGTLNISGKIDRIDLHPDYPFLQVIDYKSGDVKFDLQRVYYGLDLQILTYLSIALQSYTDYQAAGAFYQKILQRPKDPKTYLDHSTQIEDFLLHENRLEGFITLSADDMELIEPHFSPQQASQIYPIRRKKDGDYYKSNVIFDEEDLYLLLQYVHYLFQQAGEQMHQGQIQLLPYRDEQYTPTLRPQFQVITGFDPTQHYQVYQEKNIPSGQVLDAIRAILTEEGEN